MRTRARVVLALLLVGCEGRVVIPELPGADGGIAPPKRDPTTTDAALAVDGGWPADVSVRPVDAGRVPGIGEPCPGGECTEDALCVGFTGICEPKCQLPGPCNARMPECDDDRYCDPLTSFWGVCLIAEAEPGDRCGSGAADALCVGGALCVRDRSGVARCMALCEGTTCAGGRRCVGLDRGDCRVCLPH